MSVHHLSVVVHDRVRSPASHRHRHRASMRSDAAPSTMVLPPSLMFGLAALRAAGHALAERRWPPWLVKLSHEV